MLTGHLAAYRVQFFSFLLYYCIILQLYVLSEVDVKFKLTTSLCKRDVLLILLHANANFYAPCCDVLLFFF